MVSTEYQHSHLGTKATVCVYLETRSMATPQPASPYPRPAVCRLPVLAASWCCALCVGELRTVLIKVSDCGDLFSPLFMVSV